MMKRKFQKNLHIVNNLISYCHELGCTEYSVDMKLGADAVIFEVRCPIERISGEEIENITEKLNGMRQREVEQNYWELAGDFEPKSDLLFTGMMVDEADVRYEQGKLCITVKRFED